MGKFGLLLAAGLALAIVLAFAWPRWRRRRDRIRLSEARERFHLRREWMEAEFLTAASRLGTPRGLAWSGCEFEDEAVFASDSATGQLRAFVAVSISFAAIAGGGMEENPNVGNIRAATAVFQYDGSRWTTEGRAVFNLNPLEAIQHFQHQLEFVDG